MNHEPYEAFYDRLAILPDEALLEASEPEDECEHGYMEDGDFISACDVEPLPVRSTMLVVRWRARNPCAKSAGPLTHER